MSVGGARTPAPGSVAPPSMPALPQALGHTPRDESDRRLILRQFGGNAVVGSSPEAAGARRYSNLSAAASARAWARWNAMTTVAATIATPAMTIAR
jgi:hypothetical protein